MPLTTTDSIQIQVQNLVPLHDYKVEFLLHNPTDLIAYLDKNTVYFTASSNKQNAFVLLTRSANLDIVVIEVLTTDLTDNKSGSASMFVQCPNFTECDTGGYYLPLSIDTIP
jgi:hypothetical protein